MDAKEKGCNYSTKIWNSVCLNKYPPAQSQQGFLMYFIPLQGENEDVKADSRNSV